MRTLAPYTVTKTKLRTTPNGILQELIETLEGQITGAFIENENGDRLTGVTFSGVPGINATVTMVFDQGGDQ